MGHSPVHRAFESLAACSQSSTSLEGRTASLRHEALLQSWRALSFDWPQRPPKQYPSASEQLSLLHLLPENRNFVMMGDTALQNRILQFQIPGFCKDEASLGRHGPGVNDRSSKR